MYSSNRSVNLVSLIGKLLHKLRIWVRQEIVDDDPWDEETFFADADESDPEDIESESANPTNNPTNRSLNPKQTAQNQPLRKHKKRQP